MTKLIDKLELYGYLFVTPTGDNTLTAVEPSGYQVEIAVEGDMVLDRRIDSEFWDIMFIGEESYL